MDIKKSRGRPATGRKNDGSLFMRLPKAKIEAARAAVKAVVFGEGGCQRCSAMTKENNEILRLNRELLADIERMEDEREKSLPCSPIVSTKLEIKSEFDQT